MLLVQNCLDQNFLADSFRIRVELHGCCSALNDRKPSLDMRFKLNHLPSLSMLHRKWCQRVHHAHNKNG